MCQFFEGDILEHDGYRYEVDALGGLFEVGGERNLFIVPDDAVLIKSPYLENIDKLYKNMTRKESCGLVLGAVIFGLTLEIETMIIPDADINSERAWMVLPDICFARDFKYRFLAVNLS